MRWALALIGRPVTYWPARPLPSRYASVPSVPRDCVGDAQRLVEAFPGLSPALGYAFRPERPYPHVWTLDAEGVVDLSTLREGVPDGYLGVLLTPAELGGLRGRLRRTRA
jgi:hypothetical protein